MALGSVLRLAAPAGKALALCSVLFVLCQPLCFIARLLRQDYDKKMQNVEESFP